METQEFIERFEEMSEVIKNSINYKGEWRMIREDAYQKLKKKALFQYSLEDDIDLNREEDE